MDVGTVNCKNLALDDGRRGSQRPERMRGRQRCDRRKSASPTSARPRLRRRAAEFARYCSVTEKLGAKIALSFHTLHERLVFPISVIESANLRGRFKVIVKKSCHTLSPKGLQLDLRFVGKRSTWLRMRPCGNQLRPRMLSACSFLNTRQVGSRLIFPQILQTVMSHDGMTGEVGSHRFRAGRESVRHVNPHHP